MKKRAVPFAALAIVLSIALFGLAPFLAAQQPPLEKMQHLSQVLNLSPQQKSQLAPIVEAEGPKLQSVMHDPNLSPKEKKQVEAIHKQTDPLVKGILNPDQYKMWETIRKDELEQIK